MQDRLFTWVIDHNGDDRFLVNNDLCKQKKQGKLDSSLIGLSSFSHALMAVIIATNDVRKIGQVLMAIHGGMKAAKVWAKSWK